MQQLTPVVILAKQAPKKLSREGRASPTTADATEQLQQGNKVRLRMVVFISLANTKFYSEVKSFIRTYHYL